MSKAKHFASPVISTRKKQSESGEWVLSFDKAQAAEGYIVHEYMVTIKDESGKTVYKENIINDYYVTNQDPQAYLPLPGAALTSGEHYTLTLRAESAYHLRSTPLELSFTAE